MTFGQQVTGNSNVLIANVVNSAITITYQMVSTDLPLEPAAFELPADGRESPSIMLRPRYSVVPFDDYTGLVNDFEDWCLTPGEPFDLRVVSGPGGSGKTRLAVEICRRMSEHNWVAGFLRRPTVAFPFGGQLDALGDLPTARLVIVDYAETLADELGGLLQRIARHSLTEEPVRVVFLTRGPSQNATAALHAFRGHDNWLDTYLRDDVVKILPELEPTETDIEWRERLFDVARRTFASRLEIWSNTTAIDLGTATFDRPLMISIAAFLDVAKGNADNVAIPTEVIQLLDELLRHEDHYWERSLVAKGQDAGDFDLRRRVSALATLMSTDSETEGADLLSLVPDLSDALLERRHALARWIASCYPGQHYWNNVEPDLVGERLVASVYGGSVNVLSAALGERTPEQLALTSDLLSRACADYTELSESIREVLASRLISIVRIAVAQVDDHDLSAAEFPLGPRLAALVRAVNPNGEASIEAIALLPSSHRDLNDLRLALWNAAVADRELKLGKHHPEVLAIRVSMAASCFDSGRTAEAMDLQETIVNELETFIGVDHLLTLRARGSLANSYKRAGRIEDAIEIEMKVLETLERLHGEQLLDIIDSRSNLASSYYMSGRYAESLVLREQVLLDREQQLGANALETIRARSNLAVSLSHAGRNAEAIDMIEIVVAARQAQLGPRHQDTISARANLASYYQVAGRTAECIAILEDLVATAELSLGPDHPFSLATKSNLAAACLAAGRTDEAIQIFLKVLEGRERNLPPDHPDTTKTRANLEHAYRETGRATDAVEIGRRLLADRVRLLGVDHFDTISTRANLAASCMLAGNATEAIAILEEVVPAFERTLGSEHPNTIWARSFLLMVKQ